MGAYDANDYQSPLFVGTNHEPRTTNHDQREASTNDQVNLLARTEQHRNERIEREASQLEVDEVGHSRSRNIENFRRGDLGELLCLNPLRDCSCRLFLQPLGLGNTSISVLQQSLGLFPREPQICEHVAISGGDVPALQAGIRVSSLHFAFRSFKTAPYRRFATSLSPWEVLLLFFWNECSTYTASSNFATYITRNQPAAASTMISYTPAPISAIGLNTSAQSNRQSKISIAHGWAPTSEPNP